MEVLAVLADGRTNRQIAEALFITEKTAAIHVSHILGKLGVVNRVEAAATAYRLGLSSHSAPIVRRQADRQPDEITQPSRLE
jgi:DNA-binding NarL/FixJ family response regulator